MKAFLPVLFILFSSATTFSQGKGGYFMWPYGNDDKIQFTENVYFPYANTDSLYSLAKSFIFRKFIGDRDSVTFTDNSRTIICNGAFYIPLEQMGEKGRGYITFMLSIICRNKSYKYNFTNFEHVAQNSNGVSGGPLENDRPASTGFPIRYWNEEKARAYYYIQTTIESLKETMSKHSIN